MLRSRLVAVLVAAVLALMFLPGSAQAKPGGTPVVGTTSGQARGETADGAAQFLGLPYAAPPLKDLRFRPPQPPARWKGVRDATRQAPACLQFQPGGVSEGQTISEDCLYLDVYKPRDVPRRTKLPVMVWLHGGGYTQGTGTQFGGRTMAEQNNVIVISINYRMGQLGYLALPGLDQETEAGSGNWGLLDQIAALRWARDNAAAFGGDASNVTVQGQSAGSGSVCAMLASPLAAGLFSKAILQSGPCTFMRGPELAQAGRDGLAFAADAGCPDPATAAACLRRAWAPGLIAAGMKRPTTGGPTVGGGALPVQPADALVSGKWNKVPVLIGSTRSEGKMFALGQPYMTADQYTAAINAQFGPIAPQVLTRYPAAGYPAPYYAMSAVLTDSMFGCSTAKTASVLSGQTPTYVYEFDDPKSPTLYGAQLPGLDESNSHSAELAYLFDFTMGDRPLTRVQERMGDSMKRYWATFARTGDPNAWGQPYWPKASPKNELLTLRPDGHRVSTSYAAEHQCGFWGG